MHFFTQIVRMLHDKNILNVILAILSKRKIKKIVQDVLFIQDSYNNTDTYPRQLQTLFNSQSKVGILYLAQSSKKCKKSTSHYFYITFLTGTSQQKLHVSQNQEEKQKSRFFFRFKCHFYSMICTLRTQINIKPVEQYHDKYYPTHY